MKEKDLLMNVGMDMEFTCLFLKIFFVTLYAAAPILLFLLTAIVLLGHVVGRHEAWTKYDTLYWSFITATTVGYGEIKPVRRTSKALSIMIALLGLIFAGIVVAIAVKAVDHAFDVRLGPAGTLPYIRR